MFHRSNLPKATFRFLLLVILLFQAHQFLLISFLLLPSHYFLYCCSIFFICCDETPVPFLPRLWCIIFVVFYFQSHLNGWYPRALSISHIWSVAISIIDGWRAITAVEPRRLWANARLISCISDSFCNLHDYRFRRIGSLPWFAT